MRRTVLWFLVMTALIATMPAGATTVFSTDFESGLPPELSAPGASIQGVQGFAGLGPVGTQFGGNFLHYDSTSVLDTQLTLTGLPPHDHLSLGFLLAVIDSWDGVELLEVTVDGASLFSNSFQLATGDSSSYTPPPGGLLSSGTNLGFSAGTYYDHDRAYDMALEPAFIGIPHTTDTVTIVWRLLATPGGGANFWQGGTDESWALDNITVDVGSGTVTTTTVTSTSTTTSVPATTTTTLAAGCATIPDGPTFDSIRCRLEALRAATAATAALGSLVTKLDQPLGKGLDRVGKAQTQCAGSDAKHPKARLKQVTRQLLQYSHRLRGLKARKTAPANVREPLAGAADGIGRDATMLRRTLQCPADAT